MTIEIFIVDHDDHEPPYVSLIPGTTLAALRAYVDHGRRGGDFLDAVLHNDLVRSFRHADTANLEAMHCIVRYLYNRMPAVCWGSREAVEAWCAHRGFEGYRDQTNKKED